MTTLRIERLGYALGARISGVDGSKPLSAGDLSSIRKALLDHVVLCFPGQNLDAEGMRNFCAQFGEVDESPDRTANRHPDRPEIHVIANRPVTISGKPAGGYAVADQWHSDRTFTTRPTSLTFLLAKQLPSIGGNTMFANTAMAYDTLSPRYRELIDPLEAVHDATLGTTFALNPEMQAGIRERNPPVIQPLVMEHPESGRRALCIGYRVRNFVGMTEEETKPMLGYLTEHSTRYEFIYRHVWSENDLVVWDNRCAMHYAVRDYDSAEVRMLFRCALLGAETGRLVEPPRVAASLN